MRLAGRYRQDRAEGAWSWSPEMYGVLGIRAGAAPSSELLLRAVHREDRARLHDAFTAALLESRPFCLEVRVDRDGALRWVVVLGEPHLDADGRVTAVDGVCLDVTDGRQKSPEGDRLHALQTEIVQLRTAMASRSCIEQAKGILMLLTTCSEQVAFELLAHISSHTHRKVRDVARVLTESAAGRTSLPADVRAILRDACPPTPPMH